LTTTTLTGCAKKSLKRKYYEILTTIWSDVHRYDTIFKFYAPSKLGHQVNRLYHGQIVQVTLTDLPNFANAILDTLNDRLLNMTINEFQAVTVVTRHHMMGILCKKNSEDESKLYFIEPNTPQTTKFYFKLPIDRRLFTTMLKEQFLTSNYYHTFKEEFTTIGIEVYSNYLSNSPDLNKIKSGLAKENNLSDIANKYEYPALQRPINLPVLYGKICLDEALQISSNLGHAKLVEYFIDKGANVNICSINSASPVFGALENGDIKTIKAIVNAKEYDHQNSHNGISPQERVKLNYDNDQTLLDALSIDKLLIT
jgi:hypothetical protein